MPIRKLSPLLINQIAAGEVIERPASVVKELAENSLDAGATRIDVQVEEGGSQLVRISDNGGGIAADELVLAVAPHATSKLQTSEQLGAIATLGFRGEALASIASVSRLRITSLATVDGRAAEAGAMIEASGDEVSPVTPAACAPGTVIEVRDLFFNTPARRKFMRAASTEFGQVTEVITRLAMAHPHVGFSLSHHGRKTMDLPAVTSRRQRCVDVLGKELDEALMEFESSVGPAVPANGGQTISDWPAQPALPGSQSGTPHPTPRTPHPVPYRIWGLAGLPAIARATAKFQYICLNGRFIRDRNISHAIKEAYRGLVPPDRQPVAVVFLELDPTLVDVNVHPTKAEVRFREPSRIHGLVLTALRNRLLGADLTPSATIKSVGQRLAFADRVGDGEGEAEGGRYAGAGAVAGATPQAAAGPGASSSPDAFVDFFRRMAPVQKGFVYQQVREAMAETHPEVLADPPPAASRQSFTDSAASQTPPLPLGSSGHVPPILRSFGVLQVHKSYLVTEDEQGILIIDQHALHERVMFEQLRARVTGKNLESQRLLMPVMLAASAKRQAAIEALGPLMDRIGIEAAPAGPDTLAIHAFPTFLFDRKVDPAEFVTELLDQVEEEQLDATNPTALESALHEVLDMMACKAAVKAGDRLTPEELAALLQQRDEIERASNCPHGRPTTIRLTLRELEKQFKRT